MKAARLYVMGIVGVVAGVWALATVAGCANEQQQKGHELYSHYCSPCHGRDGAGHGPVALALKTPPADLRMLAARNKGVFPRARVRNYITNGTGDVAAHGTNVMPVWGPTFRALDSSDRSVAMRIANLVEYLATIQQ